MGRSAEEFFKGLCTWFSADGISMRRDTWKPPVIWILQIRNTRLLWITLRRMQPSTEEATIRRAAECAPVLPATCAAGCFVQIVCANAAVAIWSAAAEKNRLTVLSANGNRTERNRSNNKYFFLGQGGISSISPDKRRRAVIPQYNKVRIHVKKNLRKWYKYTKAENSLPRLTCQDLSAQTQVRKITFYTYSQLEMHIFSDRYENSKNDGGFGVRKIKGTV